MHDSTYVELPAVNIKKSRYIRHPLINQGAGRSRPRRSIAMLQTAMLPGPPEAYAHGYVIG